MFSAEYLRGSDIYGTRQIDIYPVVQNGVQTGVRVMTENTDSLSILLGMQVDTEDLQILQSAKTVGEACQALLHLAEKYPHLIYIRWPEDGSHS